LAAPAKPIPTNFRAASAFTIVYDFSMQGLQKLFGQPLLAAVCLLMGAPHAAAQAPDVRARVAELFRDKCIDCHGADMAKPKAGFKGVELVDELLKNPKYVKRFDPANSLLYQYLSGAQTPQMPKGDDPLSEEELAAVRAWIGEKPAGGGAAPVAPAAFKARPIVDDEAVVKIIHADLASMPAAERAHYRYITYTNLWNERIPEGASAAEQAKFQNDTDELIKSTRLGFAKMLNSLSWSPAMAMPKRIDRDGLVERIDLRGILCAERQYHWSSTQWDMLCARYPYGRAIGIKQEEEIVQWLGTEMPFVRADWFVHATSRPPLYHDLLGLPGGDGKPGADTILERMLGVDVRKNILEGMHVARAGIRDKQSGVSQHNRLIERHELADGAYYWKSYDFEDSVGTGNLVMHPLGPSNLEGLPDNQREFAFEHAGGEIIFSLPNGLQGYLLVTEDGTRIDDGPSKIVFDRDDSADVKGQITNGISCIACHSGGINLKLDQIRDGSLKILPRGLRDELEALFPANEAMDRMQKADKARFMAAVARLGITDGCDQTQCESVRKVSLRFGENLTFERAAAEFGASVGDFREAFGGKLKGLRAQLESGAVSRAEFINRFRQVVADNPDFGEMSGCGPAKVFRVKIPPATPGEGATAISAMEYCVLRTTKGDIVLELNTAKAPISVANFVDYVKSGQYDGTVFHRVIPSFMIQGGGFTAAGDQKKTKPSIQNEWKNGLKNMRGTIAMARTDDPNSATAQFFINHKDNPNLDQPISGGPGYAVFGQVVAGMDIVDAIAAEKTTVKRDMPNWPVADVTITKAEVLTKDDAIKAVDAEKAK
jgi:cyclophilin family peptidyl-prolyl cis-trans isomerase/mono/diheme cytochrome c family protein